MTAQLSYLAFHAVFVLPPILCLGWLARARNAVELTRGHATGVAIIAALAVGYTAPWDAFLVAEGVWWYGEGAVAATVGGVPIGEYLFFVLQPALTALWLFQWSWQGRSLRLPRTHRLAGAAGGLAIGVAGWLWLGSASTFYLGAITLWAGPILAVQWAFGLTYLWDVRAPLALSVAVPTCYLWLVDRIAIGLGIWVISDAHTTGDTLVGLPIEEALFFLVTNVFAVQGIVLYLWLLERRHDLPSVDRLRDRVAAVWEPGS